MKPLRGKLLTPEEGAALREMFEGDPHRLDSYLDDRYPQRAEGGLGEDQEEAAKQLLLSFMDSEETSDELTRTSVRTGHTRECS